MRDLRSTSPRARLPRAAWVVVGLVFLLPIMVWGLTQVRLTGNIDTPVGASHPNVQTYEWFRSHFASDTPILVSWDGSALDDERIPMFLDEVLGPLGDDGRRSGGLTEVASIQTPHELIDRIVASSDVTHEEAVDRVQGVLIGPGALRVRLTDEARPFQHEVLRTLRKDAKRLQMPLEILPATPEPVTLARSAAEPVVVEPGAMPLERAINADDWHRWAPHDFAIAWAGLRPKSPELVEVQRILKDLQVPGKKDTPAVEASFFLAGSPIALAVTLTESGRAERAATLKKLEAAAVRVGIAPKVLHLSGQDVLGVTLDEALPKVAWNPAVPWFWPQRSLLLLSIIAGALVTMTLLKNVRLSVMVLGITYVATLFATAIVPMLGNVSLWQSLTGSSGEYHLLLILMPPLILAVTLASAIDIASEWQQAAVINPLTAALQTYRRALRPGLWSAATMALGLLALLASPLQPVRDFGLYGAIGVVISLGLTLIGLPACLRLFPPVLPQGDDVDTSMWRTLGRGVIAARWAVLGLMVVGCGVACYGLRSVRTETRIIRTFEPSQPIVKNTAWMEQNVAGTVPVEIVVRFDRDAQNELSFIERANKVRQIGRTLRRMPEFSGSLSLADFIPSVADPGPEATPAKRRLYVTRSREIEEQTLARYGVTSYRTVAEQPSAHNAQGDELWRITAHLSLLADASYGQLLPKIDAACREPLRTVAGGGGETFRKPGEVALYHPGASHLVTGEVPLLLATHEQMLRSLSITGWLAGALVAGALVLQLWNLPAGLLALLPNVLPVAAVFGIMSWLNLPIGLTTALTASIALGLCLDGTVHLLTAYRTARLHGFERFDAVVAAMERCTPAAFQTNLVLGVAMIVLTPCDILVIGRFGMFMAALTAASLLSDTLFTPALLAGPLGWVLDHFLADKLAAAKAAHDNELMKAPLRLDEARDPAGPHAATTSPRIVRPVDW